MITLEDEFGQRTRFEGVELARENTNSSDKPQWIELVIWRTIAGRYIVQRTTHYRWRHADPDCAKLGHNLVPRPVTATDTYPCPACGDGNYGVETRSSVEVCATPTALVELLTSTGSRVSGLARAVLADVSEEDDAVAALWLDRVVK